MRILFCNYEYPPLGGGGGVVMAALARQLAHRHEVTVLTSRAAELAPAEEDHGVHVVRVPVFFRRQLAVANFPSMLAYLPMGLLRGMTLGHPAGIDVINTHFVVPTGPLGQALARWHGVPNVLSVHGGDLFDPSKRSSPHRHALLRAAIRRLLHAADAVVGQSRNTLEHVRDIYGMTRSVGLIPLGIDRPPPVHAASRTMFGLPAHAFVMVTVGRLVARKATQQLVDILAAAQIPQSHLVIAGTGPQSTLVARRAAELGVSERVHQLGQICEAEKQALLAVADVFVSASQHEGFGLVFLEAMAAGLPVVCYDHGGQADFLVSGETGYPVNLNDMQAFADALRRLHADRQLRGRIGEINRLRVEKYFIDNCAAQYETVFAAALERSPRKRLAVSG
jgi:glycosyltransferase involved in cell wall biosynthesis